MVHAARCCLRRFFSFAGAFATAGAGGVATRFRRDGCVVAGERDRAMGGVSVSGVAVSSVICWVGGAGSELAARLRLSASMISTTLLALGVVVVAVISFPAIRASTSFLSSVWK